MVYLESTWPPHKLDIYQTQYEYPRADVSTQTINQSLKYLITKYSIKYPQILFWCHRDYYL